MVGEGAKTCLPVDGFKWEEDLSMFTPDFIKNYNNNSDIGYLFYVDITYPHTLRDKHSDLPFLPDRMLVNKVNKLICSEYDKTNYSVHILALQQALKHGLILKKVHKVISFRQGAWLEPYITMNTELRTKANNEFEKDYYKLKNNSVYGKTMENIRKHRDIHLVTNDKKRSKLVSEPNYHATKCISKNLLVMEMKKREIYMKKPVYLGQAILDISKTLMYKFWYEYIKPKYADNAKLCYMDTDSFVIHVKTNDFFHDINNDVNLWFDTSNYITKLPRPLSTGKNKKVLVKFKDELCGKIISELCCLKAKTYSYKLDDDSECKKAKGTKKCIVKRHIIFDNYLDTLFKTTKLLKTQYTFKSDHHTLYTQKLNKIALNFFDDKRIQCNDKITTYPYGYFDNTSNIIDEIKNNTKELNKFDNSGVIPQNYNNAKDIYVDNAKRTCLDIIKCAYAYVDSTKSVCIDIIKSTNVYIDCIKSICNDEIKSNKKDILKLGDNSKIERINLLNKTVNSFSKDKNILVDDRDGLLNRMKKIKDKSKKRVEESNEYFKEYRAINSKTYDII